MEQRVARLEADVSEMKADLKTIRTDLAWLRGRAESTPTTWQFIVLQGGQFIALAGLIITAIKLAK